METDVAKVNPSGEFWSCSASKLLQQLESSPQGLSSRDARQRLIRHGPNLLKRRRKTATLSLLLSQFSSPIVLMLIFAAGLSFYLEDRTDALIIVDIVLASGLLGF